MNLYVSNLMCFSMCVCMWVCVENMVLNMLFLFSSSSSSIKFVKFCELLLKNCLLLCLSVVGECGGVKLMYLRLLVMCGEMLCVGMKLVVWECVVEGCFGG